MPSSASSRSTRARCPRSSRGSGRRPSASAISSATSSTVTESSSTSQHAGARQCAGFRQRPRSSSTATIPSSARLRGCARVRSSSVWTILRWRAPRSSMPPIRSTACSVGRRTSTRPPTWGTSASTSAPPAETGVPHLTWRRERSSWTASSRCPSHSPHPRESGACACACRVSTTCTTRSQPLRSA